MIFQRIFNIYNENRFGAVIHADARTRKLKMANIFFLHIFLLLIVIFMATMKLVLLIITTTKNFEQYSIMTIMIS